MTQALPHIDDSLVSYTPLGPEFEALVASTLGNVADASDGWEHDMAAILALFAATDAADAALDPVMYELGLAIDGFNALDTATWATEALAAVPALEGFAESAKLAAIAPLALPGLPSLPGVSPPSTPPVVCLPAPSPTPRPTPTPTPTPPPSNPCPPGYSFVSGGCQPPPVTPSAGGPPVVLPPLPVGKPPCPPGFVSSGAASDPCKPTSGPGSGDSTLQYVIALGQQIVSFVTFEEMSTAAIGWVEAFGLTTLTAIPIAGAIIAAGALVISLLGGGCGDVCIEASKVEQVYEAVCDNILAIARAGMLGSYQAKVAIWHFQGVAYTALKRLGTEAGINAAGNMFRVTAALVDAASLLPATAAKPLTLAAARPLYVGGPGWYADSLNVARQLTDLFVQGAVANM